MGCSCFGDRSPPPVLTETPKDGPAKKPEKRKPSKDNPPEFQSPQIDLRIRSVDSIRTLQESINTLYRIIRTLRSDKRSTLYLVENNVTLQRCLIREVVKKGKKDLGGRQMKLPLEAEIWSKLDHPHVLKLYEVVQDSRCLYFVSEAFQGGELSELLEQQHNFFEERVAQIMHQIFSVLVYFHRQKITYRNLQIQNLVLSKVPTTEQIFVKVIGFDDACLKGKKKPLHNSTVDSMFIAPEVHTNHFNEKCDIWSCGILMYTMIVGESPYCSSSESELLLKTQRGAVNYSDLLWKRLSPEGQELLKSLLSFKPEQRPSAADCLNSPWILRKARRPSVSQKALKASVMSLTKVRDIRAIKRAVMTFIVSRIVRPADLEELIEIFKVLDKNSDGQISREELQDGLQKIMSRDDANSQINRIMKQCDENVNGTIDYTEFLILAYNEEKLLSENNLKMAFDSLDRDGSKKIDLTELKNLLFLKNEHDSEDLWDLVMKELDRSGDREIDYGEFRALMAKAYLM